MYLLIFNGRIVFTGSVFECFDELNRLEPGVSVMDAYTSGYSIERRNGR